MTIKDLKTTADENNFFNNVLERAFELLLDGSKPQFAKPVMVLPVCASYYDGNVWHGVDGLYYALIEPVSSL